MQSANSKDNDQPKLSERGFSLVEVIISIVIFLIVASSVYGLLEVARSDRFTTNQRVEILQAARNSLNAIGREAVNSGYKYPISHAFVPDDKWPAFFENAFVDPDSNPEQIPPIISGNNINLNNLSGQFTDQITFLFVDPSFNNNESLFISNCSLTGDKVTLNADPPADAITTNSLYLIVGSESSALGVVTRVLGRDVMFEQSDVLNLNNPNPDAPIAHVSRNGGIITGNASLSRLTFVTFRVLADGTLVRTINGTAEGKNVALIDGAEDMQIQYVTKDGVKHDDLSSASVARDVRQIIVTMRVRGTEPDRRTNQLNRTTLSSTFYTRNLGYTAR